MTKRNLDRYVTAKRMRESGASFRAIGDKLGISPSRARELATLADKYVERMRNDWANGLPTLTANALKMAGCENRKDVARLVSAGTSVSNLGKKGLATVITWLGDDAPPVAREQHQASAETLLRAIKTLERAGYSVVKNDAT